MSNNFIWKLIAVVLSIVVSACGTAARDASQKEYHSVGGVIKGLAGAGLELRNTVNGDSLVLELPKSPGEDIAFAFPKTVENSLGYDIIVHTQPHGSEVSSTRETGRWQTCAVVHGKGQISNSDVNDIVIDCKINPYLLTGTVSGLDVNGTGVTLKVVSGEKQESVLVKSNGAFAFTQAVDSGENYTVDIESQPSSPTQICGVNNEKGLVQGRKIDNIGVVCSTRSFKLFGSVVGQRGPGLNFKINDYAPDISTTSNFEFPSQLPSGKIIKIDILSSPRYQTCKASPANGAVGGEDYVVTINCEMTPYRVRGVVHGLEGAGLKIDNERFDGVVKGNNPIAIDPAPVGQPLGSDVAFEFDVAVPSQSLFNVSVINQPAKPWQKCTVRAGTGGGKIEDSDIGGVEIDCETATVKLGGSISGLVGSLNLTNNGANEITVKANGNFDFTAPVRSGRAYNVAVSAQPRYVAGVAGAPPTGLSQTCEVQKTSSGVSTGVGVVENADIASVRIVCRTNSFPVGGSLVGLATGKTVELRNNVNDIKTLTTDGNFNFGVLIESGGAYNVAATAPDTQRCDVTGNAGTVTDGPIGNVQVTCSYLVGGTVAGLATNGSLKLKNGTEVITVTGAAFKFLGGVAMNAAYEVTVDTQPTGQRCLVTGGKGTASGSGIPAVTVTCSYLLSGSVSGLATGSTLKLSFATAGTTRDNINVTTSAFQFAVPVTAGADFTVSAIDPTGQKCNVSNPTGTASGPAPLTAISVTCAYLIGGTLSNLATGAQIKLANNGGDILTLSADGAFKFATPIAAGLTPGYNVTVNSQPANQLCSVTNGKNGANGVTGAIITNVAVTCRYLLSGSVTSMATNGKLTLKYSVNDVVQDTIDVTGASFQFNVPVDANTNYTVAIQTQPTGQQCTVATPTDSASGARAAAISVSCVYVLSGQITGLATGSKLVLKSGSETLDVTASTFQFSTPVAASTDYTVTGTDPAGQKCAYTNLTGRATGTGPLPAISITCAYIIGGTLSHLATSPAGAKVELQNNAGEKIVLSANGAFTFTQTAAAGATKGYDVKVVTDPTDQRCRVINGSGPTTGAVISNLSVDCDYLLGGQVTTLDPGMAITLSNGNETLSTTGNGRIQFSTPIATGGNYDIKVSGPPAGRECRVINGKGVVGEATINDITVSCATLKLFAGNLGGCGYIDGNSNAVRFCYPNGFASHSNGDLLIADSGNGVIRKLSRSGVVGLYAGVVGNLGRTDGTLSSAKFIQPTGMAYNSVGDLFVMDSSYLRKIDRSGNVTTVMQDKTNPPVPLDTGVGGGGTAHGIAIDSSNNIYFPTGKTIAKVTLNAQGLATVSTFVDATAGLNYPDDVVFDSNGNLFVADALASVIFKVTPNGAASIFAGQLNIAQTVDGIGTAARFYSPRGMAIDRSNNLIVADFLTVRKVTPTAQVTTIAGNQGQGTLDGTGAAATFDYVEAILAHSDGNIFVAQRQSSSIRKIDTNAAVTTMGVPAQAGFAEGQGDAARFYFPEGITSDGSGNLFVAVPYVGSVRKITPTGLVSSLALSASIGRVSELTSDPLGNLYLASPYLYTIQKLDKNGNVSNFTGAGTQGSLNGNSATAQFSWVSALTGVVDTAGQFNLYALDQNAIRKISPAGDVTTYAGQSNLFGSLNGFGTAARFTSPQDMASDATGNLYVADTGNCIIRKVATNTEVTTIAGAPGDCAIVDGPQSVARFLYPKSIEIASNGDIYVADGGYSNNVIRKIDSKGNVTTVLGAPELVGFVAGNPGVLGDIKRMVIFGNKLYLVAYNGVALVIGLP